VDPGDCHDARIGSDRAEESVDDRVLGGVRRLGVKADASNCCAGALGLQPQRLVRGEEVVFRRESFLARPEVDSVVEQAEPHGRRVGERDVARARAEVLRGCCQHTRFGLGAVLVDVVDGIPIEACSVRLDRVSDRRWMGRQVQKAEVQVRRVEEELVANRAPRVAGLRFGDPLLRDSPRDTGRRESQPGANKEASTIHLL
jgi:hypothetical protein